MPWKKISKRFSLRQSKSRKAQSFGYRLEHLLIISQFRSWYSFLSNSDHLPPFTAVLPLSLSLMSRILGLTVRLDTETPRITEGGGHSRQGKRDERWIMPRAAVKEIESACENDAGRKEMLSGRQYPGYWLHRSLLLVLVPRACRSDRRATWRSLGRFLECMDAAGLHSLKIKFLVTYGRYTVW